MERAYENVYNNKGQRRTIIQSPLMKGVDRMRRLLTAIDMELMEDEPNQEVIASNCQMIIMEIATTFDVSKDI